VLAARSVSTRRELDEWIALTDRLYSGVPQFVPPVRQRLRALPARKDPVLRHGEIELLSVVRDGVVVARATAHTNAKLDAKLGARQLLFGFTEFDDDDEVFAALADALTERARRIGAARLFGPVSLLPNQSGGVVTSGYEERGFVDSPWNPPYYPALYERHGFVREFEGETFVVPLEQLVAPPDELIPIDEERIAREELVVRRANPRRMKRELAIIRQLLNASFAQLGYYTEIDEDELAYQVAGLGYLLDSRIALYLLKAGEPVAFILCIPDISTFLQKVGGDLSAPNLLRLLLTRKRYRSEAICVIQGTLPAEQRHGYIRLLTRELLRNLRGAGYRTLRGTFIEHENTGSSAYADRLGRPAHGVTLYSRPVE
jgi:GNAT superfamily N-acetyltransferase